MVFQNYALYPHMTAMENVAFPLKTQRLPRERIALAVEQALALVDLTGLEERYPRQLSGGEQQRVALARMLVGQPEVLLFDEPLSNVDAKLRLALRADLKRLHRRTGATALYVTHDVSEAFAMADRIAIMFHGVVHQVGRADDLYHHPETLQVAEMTGLPQSNLIAATATRTDAGILLAPTAAPERPFRLPGLGAAFDGQRVVLNVRVEDLELRAAGERDDAGPLFEVFAVLPQGAATLIHLRFAGRREELVARVAGAVSPWRTGQRVRVQVRRGNLYDAATERLIDTFDHSEMAA
jgi:multiple sugar transport system ATP-binding protein